MTSISKAACLGGGVIGGGWAARFALNGIDVAIYDPDPEAERKVAEVMANAERALRKLCVAPLPEPGTITFTKTLAKAVDGAEWIQESVPERLDIKHLTYAAMEKHAAEDALIGSSTSGFKPSELQQGLERPGNVFVAHPFNPVYLLPMVELVPSPATDPAVIDRAADILETFGMRPLKVRREIEAHLADRLLEAVWREALWLVKDGYATTEEIDDSIRFGFGMRWAQMGLFETYRIAGGEAGMRHFLAQFGPTLSLPWSRLMDVPDYDDALVDLIAAQSDAQSGAHSIRELERIRDDNLVGIMQALKGREWGAGATLAAYEKRLREASFGGVEAEHNLLKPLPLHSATVLPEWTDYNGHMTEYRYLHVFGDSTDAFLTFIGMDSAYLAKNRSVYTVETHIRHIREVHVGRALAVETQLLGHDEKRIRICHTMREGESGEVLATGEHMMLSVDTEVGKAVPMQDPLPARLGEIWDGHRALDAPDFAGRAIRAVGAS